MIETKVYKLHESKQVEDIATMLKIEGIKYQVFEYEEYTAIEVTGTPLEIIKPHQYTNRLQPLSYNEMEILIVFGCLYTGYRIFRKKGEHFFDI